MVIIVFSGLDWNLLAMETNTEEVISFTFEKLYHRLLLLEARFSSIRERANGRLDSFNFMTRVYRFILWN